MKGALLDVNLLVALAWPSHIHHQAAHAWFAGASRHGWATCPITQCGFVRVSSNPTCIEDAVAPLEALAVLRAIMALPGHVFWEDEPSLQDGSLFADFALGGHRQITDAYLLSLAVHRRGRLATLDRGVASLAPKGSIARRAVLWISPGEPAP